MYWQKNMKCFGRLSISMGVCQNGAFLPGEGKKINNGFYLLNRIAVKGTSLGCSLRPKMDGLWTNREVKRKTSCFGAPAFIVNENITAK